MFGYAAFYRCVYRYFRIKLVLAFLRFSSIYTLATMIIPVTRKLKGNADSFNKFHR